MNTKKILFTILIFFNIFSLKTFSQSGVIYFNGKNIIDYVPVTIDSIHVENLSSGKDTTLIGSNELDLGKFTNVDLKKPSSVSSFRLTPNYPNGFSVSTRFDIELPFATDLSINVHNILGQKIATKTDHFVPGIHSFILDGTHLSSGIYFIKVLSENGSKSIKALKIGKNGGNNGNIVYVGSGSNSNLLSKKTNYFDPNDEYLFTGFAHGFLPESLNKVIPKAGKNYGFLFKETNEIQNISSVWEPVFVGRPPRNAFIGLVRPFAGEIRHYNYEHKIPHYIASYDDGLTWNSTVFLPTHFMGADTKSPVSGEYLRVHYANNTSVIRLRSEGGIDGEWNRSTYSGLDNNTNLIMLKPPIYIDYNGGKRVIVGCHGEDRKGAACLFSDDDGETWTLSERVVAPHHQPGGIHLGTRWNHGAVEPTIIQLNDGRLWMIMRTAQDNHYEAFSEDGGETWTEAQPSRFFGTITMPTIGRLSDGRILFLWCNTTPLPEKAGAGGYWEDVFTNRDAIHAAISEDDGKTWIGFREIWLNDKRNNSKVFASNTYGNDKSVHQAQFVECGEGKVLVSCGQNALMRSIVIFDLDWLYERERSDDFSAGLRNWSVHNYYAGVVGHVAYNRTRGADLVEHPDLPGKKVLKVCNIQLSPPLEITNQGAVWNFPAGHGGTFNVRFMLQDGSKGAQISLADRWFNPSDTTAYYFTNYTIKINSDGDVLGENMITPGQWHNLEFKWELVNNETTARCQLFVDDVRKIENLPLNNSSLNGISYVHFHSPAVETDSLGFLIEHVHAFTSLQ